MIVCHAILSKFVRVLNIKEVYNIWLLEMGEYVLVKIRMLQIRAFFFSQLPVYSLDLQTYIVVLDS